MHFLIISGTVSWPECVWAPALVVDAIIVAKGLHAPSCKSKCRPLSLLFRTRATHFLSLPGPWLECNRSSFGTAPNHCLGNSGTCLASLGNTHALFDDAGDVSNACLLLACPCTSGGLKIIPKPTAVPLHILSPPELQVIFTDLHERKPRGDVRACGPAITADDVSGMYFEPSDKLSFYFTGFECQDATQR